MKKKTKTHSILFSEQGKVVGSSRPSALLERKQKKGEPRSQLFRARRDVLGCFYAKHWIAHLRPRYPRSLAEGNFFDCLFDRAERRSWGRGLIEALKVRKYEIVYLSIELKISIIKKLNPSQCKKILKYWTIFFKSLI